MLTVCASNTTVVCESRMSDEDAIESPERVTFCGDPLVVLSAMLTVPATVPVVLGAVKVTPIVQ